MGRGTMLPVLNQYLGESELREILTVLGEETNGNRLQMTSRLLRRLKSRDPTIVIEDDDLNLITLLTEAMMVSGKEAEIEGLVKEFCQDLRIKEQKEEEELGDIIEPKVEFDDLLDIIAESKIDWRRPRERIISDLMEHMGRNHLPVESRNDQAIVVASNIAIELELGADNGSIDGIMQRMLWDHYVYGSVIGIIYGVEDDRLANEIEVMFDALFEDQTSVAIMLL